MKQLSLLEFARLRTPDVSDVEALADDIVDELGLEPPIDVRLVASYLGVARVEVADLDVAGCLVCGRDGALIKVRATDGYRRQRFTVLHECAHTWFPGYELRPQYRCDPSEQVDDAQLEGLCDAGASGLLLPRRLLTSDLASSRFGIDTLEEIADHYQASLEATGYRIAELAPDPTMFMVLDQSLKPSEYTDPAATPKLRVRTARGRRGEWPFIPRHKSVPEGSPLDRALQGEAVDEVCNLVGLTRNAIERVTVSARLAPVGDRKRVLALVRRIQ